MSGYPTEPLAEASPTNTRHRPIVTATTADRTSVLDAADIAVATRDLVVLPEFDDTEETFESADDRHAVDHVSGEVV